MKIQHQILLMAICMVLTSSCKPPYEKYDKFSRDLDQIMIANSDEEKVSKMQSIIDNVDQHGRLSANDDDIKKLILLLNSDNDAVRFQAAGLLGMVGPRAAGAVPDLEKALHKVECVNADLTSEAAIRPALRKIRGYDAPKAACKSFKQMTD